MKLGSKFVLLIISILATTMSVDAYLNYSSQKKSLLSNLVTKTDAHGSFVSLISTEAVLAIDYVVLDSYMRNISVIQDVVYGIVLAKDKQPLSSYIHKKNKLVQEAVEQVKSENIIKVSEHLLTLENIIEFNYPIVFEDLMLGEIRIGINTARIENRAQTGLVRQLVENAAIIAFLSVCIYFVFRTNTLYPISLLVKGAERISSGNLEEEVTNNSEDELGLLTKSFNQMMLKLKQSVEEKDDALLQLQELNKNLEGIVKERTSRLELAQQMASMGHWDYTSKNDCLVISNEVCRIIEMPDGTQLSARQIFNLIHRKDRKTVRTHLMQSIAKNLPFNTEFRIVKKEKQIVVSVFAETSGTLSDNNFTVTGIIQDITGRKEAELVARDALLEKNNAETANEAKSAFLANMSHEIRTPLTSIIGFAETSMDSAISDKERSEAIATVIRNGKHLLHVINELLDLSKIESSKLATEILEVNLYEILNDVEALLGLQANEKSLQLKFEYQYPLPIVIQTDPTRLKQILINIVGNAIKFTHEGFVRLEVGFDKEKSKVTFCVTDTGIGITEEKQKKLFSPFQQADSSTTRLYGGTGLGLFISKRLIELLGGDISLNTILKLGTRVNFEIDAGPVTEDNLTNRFTINAELSRKTTYSQVQLVGDVLVAEDSEDIQRLISWHLSKIGLNVSHANTGKIAVEKGMVKSYDLMLMDMQMPEMDGVEAISLLRASGYSKPIVSLTANAMNDDIERCLKAGATEFLAKPIEIEKLIDVLLKYIPTNSTPEETISTDNKEQQKDKAASANNGMSDLILQFIDGLDQRLKTIEQGASENDWEIVAAEAHILKGLGGSFGYPQITDIAGLLENLVRTSELSEAGDQVIKLSEASNQIISEWRKSA